MLTQEQIDNTLNMMQMAGVSSDVLKQTRERLQAQLEAEKSGGLPAAQKNMPSVKKTRTLNAAANKASKSAERTGEAEDILSEARGKKYNDESDANDIAGLVSGKEDTENTENTEGTEDIDKRNSGIKDKLDNGGMIATGKTGRRVLMKDENSPTGYTEKKRRKVNDVDLKWADEYQPKEGDKLTTGQQQALKVKELLNKYKPLDKKQRKSKYKVNPGPQMTANELQEMSELKQQLWDRDNGAFWYIPTDEELEQEKNARAMEYGEKHAAKEKALKEITAEFKNKGITIPFAGNASMSIDFSPDFARKGNFPVIISSNGQTQHLFVPFTQLKKLKDSVKEWAGNEPVSMTFTGTDPSTGDSISSDAINRLYPKAWQSMDFSDTPLPKLMSGFSTKDFQGPGFNYAKDYYDLNSTYHNNPKLYQQQHNELRSEAEDMMMSYPEYMQFLQDSLIKNNREDIQDAKQALLDAYKSKDPKAVRSAVENYLSEAASKSENRMTKEAVARQLENLRSGNVMNEDEALNWAKKKVIGQRRNEIRDDVRYQNAFTAQRLHDMVEKRERMKGYLDKAKMFDDAQSRYDLYNALPSTDMKMDREGNLYSVTGEGDDADTQYYGNVRDMFQEDDMQGVINDLFRSSPKGTEEINIYKRPPHPQTGIGEGLVRGSTADLGSDEAYGSPLIFSKNPLPSSQFADKFRKLYENAGGDDVYNMLNAFNGKELADIIGKNKLGTVMTDLVDRPLYDPETKEMVLDKNGNPVMVPRLVMDTSYLPNRYKEEGIGVPRRDRLSRFRRDDGSIDTESYNAWRLAVLARAIEAQKQALAADRLMAINDFQEKGGLSNEEHANNAKIYKNIVDNFDRFGGSEEDRKIAEEAAEKHSANKELFNGYKNLINSVFSDLKNPEMAKEHLGLDRDYPMSKDDLRQLMSRSKYIRAGKDSKERRAAFLKLLLDKIGLMNPETYVLDNSPEVDDMLRTDSDE